MKENDGGLIVFIMLLLIIAFVFGAGFKEDYWKREAVKQGHAEYVTNEQGEAIWQWKEVAK